MSAFAYRLFVKTLLCARSTKVQPANKEECDGVGNRSGWHGTGAMELNVWCNSPTKNSKA